MRVGIAALVLAYVLSQFYRAFLAVLSPVLAADIGATAENLASASGLWFLAFALMQIPVGEALDRIGPRLTTAGLLAMGGIGAAVFAMATGPGAINVAMVLIGMGCAPVLMAAYYIFARSFSPAVFGTLAGVVIGIGSLGNIAASLPLSLAVEAIGWRGAMWTLCIVTFVTAAAIWLLVRDPERVIHTSKGSLLDLLRMPALWPILIMMAACYAPAAGLRGLWAGPYLTDVFQADAERIGFVTLIMGLAMVAGNFAYGPLDRILGSRKWLVFGGNALAVACLLGLYAHPGGPGIMPVVLLAGVGFFGASFPMVMAHGRAFLPPHLIGRGVTLINLFGIGAAGIMQILTGRLHHALTPSATVINSAPPSTPYAALFAFYAALLTAGLVVYLLSKDRTD
ncbi:MAG: MFS transporter [Cypionkella sp.]|uniref:MFS transporter n=1 Tax=Cypionkella sp. TaxID=2811411 RepID=UPI002ABBB543|nr:MFS transporter [Cypionkella sp.]MDZ4309079.1 MFS transporter [Cypionkella sp.]